MRATNVTLPLDQQRVVVTGSSRGIGRAMAIAFARRGAHVVVHGRSSPARVTDVVAQIVAAGGRATSRMADLSNEVGCADFIAAVLADGPVDTLVNNAGVDVLTGAAAEMTFEQKLALLWQVDVRACVQLSRAIGSAMQACGSGAIINIGWDQAEWGMAGDSGQMFAAVKGAVMAFTRSLAKSLAPQVRVNAIAPGWIRTAWGDSANDYWNKRAESEALLTRWGTPEDVASLAVFLASPEAAFINGQIIAANGGFAGTQPQTNTA